MTTFNGSELRSTIRGSGLIELTLADAIVPAPAANEVVIRVEAAPLNPADLLLLLGPADPAGFARTGAEHALISAAPIPTEKLAGLGARLDVSLRTGNEGAGTVVATGADAKDYLGRIVAFRDASYADYRVIAAEKCIVLPNGVSAREGASASINPMTVLGMVETMRRENHSALIHTAAASNVGQMLVKHCMAERVPLVNIVRSAAQSAILRALGAEYVVDSSLDTFKRDLVAAVRATGATLAFDAIGGRMPGVLLTAMAEVAAAAMPAYDRYGSPTHRQVYIYGMLEPGPRVIEGDVGVAWGAGGWLMTFFYRQIGLADTQRLRERMLAELTTTFASTYTAEITLQDALDPDIIRAYARRATGEKYLIVPSRARE